jgi:hypothetical protein
MRRSEDLSAQQRSLVEMMRVHQFGRIENMRVLAGQPILDEDVRVVQVARLGGENSISEVACEFELKQPVRDLFDRLARLQDGVVISLEFRHGLPFLLETTVHLTPKGTFLTR